MRAKYLLPCSCGEKVAVEVARAGQTVRCACGAELDVPTMSGITALEKVEQETKAGQLRSRSGWGTREARILAGSVVLVLGVSLLAWLQWSKPRLIDIQSMSPLQSWGLWHELMLGANRDPSPGAKWFAKALSSNRNWTAVAFSLIVLGTLVTVGSFATRKKVPADPDAGG